MVAIALNQLLKSALKCYHPNGQTEATTDAFLDDALKPGQYQSSFPRRRESSIEASIPGKAHLMYGRTGLKPPNRVTKNNTFYAFNLDSRLRENDGVCPGLNG
jgi:hypothetical protein